MKLSNKLLLLGAGIATGALGTLSLSQYVGWLKGEPKYHVSYTTPADHYGIQARRVFETVNQEGLEHLVMMSSDKYILDFKLEQVRK